MSLLAGWFHALPWMLATALLAWAICTTRRNVGLVDIFWSVFLLVAALCFVREAGVPGGRALLVLSLVGIWALRLAAHLAVRNWNAPEDHRYQVIRARNQPGFEWKSLYLVFGLQAVLAFIVSLSLFPAITSPAALNLLDAIGASLIVVGLLVETIADTQLAAFRDDPASRGQVLDRGLWRYSRHPNYFGEFCVWWGFFLLALATGAWWAVFSPALMSVLLLRVSGVTLLEKDIGQRRPAYARYVARTNAFFPGPEALRMIHGNRRMSVLLVPALMLLAACSGAQKAAMNTVEKVDLQRFMGAWYVIANIPTPIEKGAHNAMESYALAEDGTIETTFTFRDGAFDGKSKSYHPRGFVLDRQTNALWGMRFIWPVKADYRIVYLSDDYSQTVIGRRKRDYVWIMARTPQIPEDGYQRLLRFVAEQGYDVSRVQRVPQRWPAGQMR